MVTFQIKEVFFKKTASSKYLSHTTQFTQFNYAIQWFLVHSRTWKAPVNSRIFFNTSKRNPKPFSYHPPVIGLPW